MTESNHLDKLFAAIQTNSLADQTTCVQRSLKQLGQDYPQRAINDKARQLLLNVRNNHKQQSLAEQFLKEYQLSSDEGILLMGIAEALLRIPDHHTQDQFLQEKLTSANWQKHLLNSDSFLVNLSTSALYVTGRLQAPLNDNPANTAWFPIYNQLFTRLGAPLIRTALKQAMQQLAYQFVIAETIESALPVSQQQPGVSYSFDMLGEAALTANDAQGYFDAYAHAIDVLSKQNSAGDLYSRSNLSIKLSALSPRYEPLQHQRAVADISQRLLMLVQKAREANVFITLDAEEAYRLQLSLIIFQTVYSHAALSNWPGFGLAVQAYQKCSIDVIHWLAELSRMHGRTIPVRLVKGAYWDTEIKFAQQHGLSDYPVFTVKSATDLSYLACAEVLFSQDKLFYPQFASHNVLTLAAITELAAYHHHPRYEFQRLHGMGEQIFAEIMSHHNWNIPCRIYAPVGQYQELLPYLVRRMLENGANNSFVNQFNQATSDLDALLSDPVVLLRQQPDVQCNLGKPEQIYQGRKNSSGLDLGNLGLIHSLNRQLRQLASRQWQAYALVDGKPCTGQATTIINPADQSDCIGHVRVASQEHIAQAIDCASAAFPSWNRTGVQQRASCLTNAADLLEHNRIELAALCMREGGRTLSDTLSEIREAVDFCRYYAKIAVKQFSEPLVLPGPTGEENQLSYQGRGVIVCISPWNFPIAIFTGQITAALAAGNTVIAKPASATVLTALRCIEILHQAGIPNGVLNFVPANGADFMQHCLSDKRIAGVAVTGSTTTAQAIHQKLAKRQMIVPLIAETGGQNAMIADNSALVQQVVIDAVDSAFNSAGQRCSALRVLFIQEETSDQVIELLIGAMQELVIGNPQQFDTDIGPVINQQALDSLHLHLQRMQQHARILYQCKLNDAHQHGYFFAPCLIELDSFSQLTEEIFGPVLHLVRYQADQLEHIIEQINAGRYGLTLGVHSRLDNTINTVRQLARVGNLYVNRNMIGAVVGTQPFGGMGLSGTGPKAGGPNYLKRFAVEQTVSINTTAIGVNPSLLQSN